MKRRNPWQALGIVDWRLPRLPWPYLIEKALTAAPERVRFVGLDLKIARSSTALRLIAPPLDRFDR
jgi:hypothetical protein